MPKSETTINVTTCDSNAVGTTIRTFTAINGCDSIVTTNTTLKDPATTNLSQEICSGSSIEFNDQTITTEGIYNDTLVTTQGCDSFIVLTVRIISTIEKEITQKICKGNSYTFNGNILTQSGTYRDTLLSSKSCDSIVILNLVVNELPVIDAVTDNATLITGQTAQLNVITSETLSYNWTPANTVNNPVLQNPIATLTESTWLIVTATNNETECSTKDSVFIEFNEVECTKENIFIPNAFSPNGDGVNDIFIPRSRILKSMKLMVQDRWGHTVFESNDINVGWDGNYKGTAALIDSYAYYFEGECVLGEKITLKGNVTLLK